jgi:hypothetical protein
MVYARSSPGLHSYQSLFPNQKGNYRRRGEVVPDGIEQITQQLFLN